MPDDLTWGSLAPRADPPPDPATALLLAMGSAGKTIRDKVAAPAADFAKSLPWGALNGFGNAATAAGNAAQIEMGQEPNMPAGPEMAAELERHATGDLPRPEGRAGHYGQSVGEIFGNPANWIGPGGFGALAGWNAASGLASETAGQAYEGTPQEGLARSLGSFGPMAAERLASVLPKVIPQGAAGVFGGRMAVTADHQALNRAEKMAKSGQPADQIWRDTGWMQGPDGKWRFEISDHAATMNPGAGNKLGDVLQHPDLFEAYPALAEVKAAPLSATAARRGASAAYTPAGMFSSGKIQYPIDGADQLPSTLHEVQHAIQQREGFTGGSSRLAELPAKFGLPFRSDAKRAQEFQDAGDRYWRNAGEVESRNVEARQLMEPMPRRFLSPMETMDVPLSEQSLTTATNGLPSRLLRAAQVGGAGMGAAASAVQIADAIAELKAKRKARAEQPAFGAIAH